MRLFKKGSMSWQFILGIAVVAVALLLLSVFIIGSGETMSEKLSFLPGWCRLVGC